MRIVELLDMMTSNAMAVQTPQCIATGHGVSMKMFRGYNGRRIPKGRSVAYSRDDFFRDKIYA